MKPYQLKRNLLYLAIQGKLVPQDSLEGTGSDILKDNHDRRIRMPSELQKRIGKGCKPIKEEDYLFEIPDNWKWERFGNLVVNYDSQRQPVTKSDRKTSQGVYDYYGATGVIDRVDEFIFEGEYLMIGEDGGNFFVDRDNAFIASGKFWANNHVHIVQPIVCNILYLKACLDAYNLPNMGLINGIAVPKLNQENLNSIMIPVPPLSEQKRIVAKIEELMPLVEEYGKAEEKLTALNADFPNKLRKSILQQAIQGKLTERDPADEPASELLKRIRAEKDRLIKEGKIKKEKPLPPITEEDIPFEIPENWTWVRIGDLFEVNPRNSVSDDTEVGFIPMPLLEPGYVNKHTYEKRLWKDIKNNFTHFQNGDIVFAKITPCFQNRKSAIICGLPNGYGAGTTELHVLRSYSGLVLNEYALWFVKNERFIVDGVEHFTGSVGQQRVGTDYIKQYPFPLPPLAEQKRIVGRVNELLAVCDEMR